MPLTDGAAPRRLLLLGTAALGATAAAALVVYHYRRQNRSRRRGDGDGGAKEDESATKGVRVVRLTPEQAEALWRGDGDLGVLLNAVAAAAATDGPKMTNPGLGPPANDSNGDSVAVLAPKAVKVMRLAADPAAASVWSGAGSLRNLVDAAAAAADAAALRDDAADSVEADAFQAAAFARAAALVAAGRGAAGGLGSPLAGMRAEDRLRLYGLYKQATAGDCPDADPDDKEPPTSPSFSWRPAWARQGAAVAAAKRAAWAARAGMTQAEARSAYVRAVRRLLPGHGLGDASDGSGGDSDSEREEDAAYEATSAGMAPVQSRPVGVENGGHSDDSDGDCDNLPTDDGDGDADLRRRRARLFRAAAANDVAELQRELLGTSPVCDKGDGADVAALARDPRTGQTLLHVAADKGALEAVQWLLRGYAALGMGPDAADLEGISVLQTAAAAGHLEVCRCLLAAGANPDQPDADGDTARGCVKEDGSPELRALFGVE